MIWRCLFTNVQRQLRKWTTTLFSLPFGHCFLCTMMP